MLSDSFKSFRSNSSSKNAKQPIRRCVGATATSAAAMASSSSSSSSSDSESDAEMKSPFSKRKKPFTIWKRKIRVICTDPDATESSSNEEDDIVLPKRLVREILIPSDCGAFPSIMSESSGCDRIHNSNGMNDLQAKTEDNSFCGKKEESSVCRSPDKTLISVPDCAKKSSSRRATTHNKASSSSKCNGARQRQSRKWSAEISDPRKEIRIWLGTCYSFEEAAKSYDSAPRKINTRLESRQEILYNSELSPYPRNAQSSLVHPSDRKDAGSGSFLDCSNGEELGLIKSSPARKENMNMVPFSSCYSGFGSLSPSSVLENATPDDCQSPNFLKSDQKVSYCANAYIDESPADSTCLRSDLVTSTMVDHIMANSGPMHSQLKIDSSTFTASNSLLSTSSYPLLEESQYYGDFSQIFSVGRSDSEPLDHLDVDIFANDGFSDVDFDNETETLAWINVAEV